MAMIVNLLDFITTVSLTEKTRSIYASHTPSGKPDGVAIHYTCRTPEAVHWASPPARQASALVREGARATS